MMVQSTGEQLQPLRIHITDCACRTLGELTIRLKREMKFNINEGNCTVHSRSIGLWATWAQVQWVGVIVATYICITYHHINVVAHMFDTWVAAEGGGGDSWPRQPSVSLAWGDIWHLHGSTDNCCELQNGPAWFLCCYQSPLQIPDWLIPLAKTRSQARRALPEWKLPCGNPWQSYWAGRGENKWGGGESWVGGGGTAGILYATILHEKGLPSGETGKSNRQKVNAFSKSGRGQLWPWSFYDLKQRLFVF